MKSSDKKTKRSSGLDMSSPPQPPSLSPATLSLIGPLKHPLFRPGKSYDYKNRKMIGNYMLGSTIGAGSMGKVKVAVRMDTKEKFAVKIIPRILPPNVPRMTKQEQESAEKRIVREASILFLCDHPHVVKLHEVIVSPSNYYLFFEYVDGGQMLDYIVTNGRLRERHARRFVRQLVSALEYIHSNSIVHRDLKIENILLTSSSTIKLIDFGLSNTFSPSSHLTTFCGSLYFASPELLNAKPYIGPEVDIWSLGVITYVLVCGKVPFDDPNMPNLHLKIKKGEVEYPGFLSDELRHFLSRMLTVEPSLRASLSELKSHPWLNKNYSSPPRSFLPPRNAISLQEGFDKEIIKNMEGFGFGDVDEIEEKLWAILRDRPHGNRNEFSKGVAKCNGKDASLPPHPILSIYVLVKEKMESEGYVSPVHSQFSSSTSLPGTSGHNSHGQNDNGNKENEDNDLRRLEILKKGGMADSGTSIDFVASSASSSDEGEDSSMADVDKTRDRSKDQVIGSHKMRSSSTHGQPHSGVAVAYPNTSSSGNQTSNVAHSSTNYTYQRPTPWVSNLNSTDDSSQSTPPTPSSSKSRRHSLSVSNIKSKLFTSPTPSSVSSSHELSDPQSHQPTEQFAHGSWNETKPSASFLSRLKKWTVGMVLSPASNSKISTKSKSDRRFSVSSVSSMQMQDDSQSTNEPRSARNRFSVSMSNPFNRNSISSPIHSSTSCSGSMARDPNNRYSFSSLPRLRDHRRDEHAMDKENDPRTVNINEDYNGERTNAQEGNESGKKKKKNGVINLSLLKFTKYSSNGSHSGHSNSSSSNQSNNFEKSGKLKRKPVSMIDYGYEYSPSAVIPSPSSPHISNLESPSQPPSTYSGASKSLRTTQTSRNRYSCNPSIETRSTSSLSLSYSSTSMHHHHQYQSRFDQSQLNSQTGFTNGTHSTASFRSPFASSSLNRKKNEEKSFNLSIGSFFGTKHK